MSLSKKWIYNDTVVPETSPFTEKWQGSSGPFRVKIVLFCHKMATDYCSGATSHSEKAALPAVIQVRGK